MRTLKAVVIPNLFIKALIPEHLRFHIETLSGFELSHTFILAKEERKGLKDTIEKKQDKTEGREMMQLNLNTEGKVCIFEPLKV